MGQARGAGLRHAFIRTADGKFYDVDAVVSLEGELEVDTTDVEGDDQTLASFASLPTESITMVANSLSIEVLAAISGQAAATIATSGKAGQEIGLGGNGTANPPFIEVGGYTVGKLKADDTPQTIKKIYHRVQLRPTGTPQEKDSEFSVTYEGVAYPSAVDIAGSALPYRRTSTIGYTQQTVDSIVAEQEATA